MIDGRDVGRPSKLTPRRERLDCCQVSPVSIVRFLRGPMSSHVKSESPEPCQPPSAPGQSSISTTSQRKAQHPWGLDLGGSVITHATPRVGIEANTKLVLQIWW